MTKPLVILAAHPTCTRCELHLTCKSVGIASRPLYPMTGRSRCLFVIGEAPGRQEDEQAKPFVGQSGDILTGWLDCLNLQPTTDVFVGNCVRCRPPENAEPPKASIVACHQHLLEDLDRLTAAYSEVYVLTVGGPAVSALRGLTITKALKAQGQPLPNYPTTKCFATYHPAYTLPSRNPAAAQSVRDHLRLLVRHLSGNFQPILDDEYTPVPAAFDRRAPRISLLSVDIETYGISTKYRQTQFVPQKSFAWDTFPREDLVLTAAIAYRLDGGSITNRFFNLKRAADRRSFQNWLDRADTLVFKNAQFDLAYLRAAGYRLPHGRPVEDVDVWNYLASDMRAEKSLKALSPLLGMAPYEDGGFHQHDDPFSPDAQTYVVKDAVDTLKARDLLRDEILRTYGEGTPKLSDFSHQWYSDLIWLGVLLTEAGVPQKRSVLISLRKQHERQLQGTRIVRLPDGTKVPLNGKGSAPVVQRIVDEAAVEANILAHKELEKTDKTKKVSTGANNLNLIEAHLDATSPWMAPLQAIAKMRWHRDILSRYIYPRVGPYPLAKGNPRLASALIATRDGSVGMVYPRVHVVPSDTPGSEETSGTKQGRITLKDPPLQTDPYEVKAALTSSFKPGFLVSLDLSQIELRMAAFLSNDTNMLGEYIQGIDPHWRMTVDIFGEPCPVHGAIRDKECRECEQKRHVGKTANFQGVYFGEAYNLRLILRRDAAFATTLAFCHEIIRKNRRFNHLYVDWVDSLVEQVSTLGYAQLPLTGAGRYFTQSLRANKPERGTIANCFVQGQSAELLLSAQVPLTYHLIDQGFRSRCCLNVYDSMAVNGPLEELDEVTALMYSFLEKSDYRRRLEDLYGRQLPVEAEHKNIVVP